MTSAMYVFTFKTVFDYLAKKDIIWTTTSVGREELSVDRGNEKSAYLVHPSKPALPGLAQCSSQDQNICKIPAVSIQV